MANLVRAFRLFIRVSLCIQDVVESLKDDLEEKQDMVMFLTDIMDKITKENQHLRAREAELQVNAFC